MIYYATFKPALAFQPTTPAKLAALGQITAQLSGGAGGTVSLYIQHLNDRLSDWASLDGVVGAWTLVGQLVHNTPIGSISLNPGPSEQVLFRLAFDDSGGIPPTLLSFSVPWTSDVTAPDAPTISLLSSVLPAGGAAGYRCDFGALPDGARHLIVEGRKNSGGWLPFSERAKFEESQGYMKFRGDIAAQEAAGERNEAHLSFMKGLSAGDVVQVRCAAEDDVGNRSVFTTSDAVTLVRLASAEPKIWIEDAELQTGETGTITVHLIGAAGSEVTVDYASEDDTAAEGNDYEAISGTVTFPASTDTHQTAAIGINATGSDPTPGESKYRVVLTNASGASIERDTGVVTLRALCYVPVIADSVLVEVSEHEAITVEVS